MWENDLGVLGQRVGSDPGRRSLPGPSAASRTVEPPRAVSHTAPCVAAPVTRKLKMPAEVAMQTGCATSLVSCTAGVRKGSPSTNI